MGTVTSDVWKCVTCLRRIYTCSRKVMTPGVFRFSVLENYNTERIFSNAESEDFVSESTKKYYRYFYDYIIQNP